jgi:hypothetical protein
MNKLISCHQIPGLAVLVDGFRHAYDGCTAYFLSHYHGKELTTLTSCTHTQLTKFGKTCLAEPVMFLVHRAVQVITTQACRQTGQEG